MAPAFEELIIIVGLAVVGAVHFAEWVAGQVCDAYDRIRERLKRSFNVRASTHRSRTETPRKR